MGAEESKKYDEEFGEQALWRKAVQTENIEPGGKVVGIILFKVVEGHLEEGRVLFQLDF